MEENRREAGSPSPAAAIPDVSPFKSTESPATEPPAPRRRGQKRKSTSTTASGSSSAPPKRHAREKAAAAAAAASAGLFSLLPPIHNGPLTRARQLSDNNAAISSALNAVKDDTSAQDSTKVEEVNAVKKELEAFQAAVDAEFDKIRSRDVNSHVVPVPAGWFSWTKIHPLEKQTLHSFFNGRSENRTPEIYMEIRNWIMKKFHASPATNIELKDLSDLSVGDSDARQEVMEFLDHWGLINYHPFPLNDPENVDANPNIDGGKAEKTDSLIEKLYQFENEQSYPELVPRGNMSTQATPTGLLRESAIAEEFMKQEGPAVEYHCNSCSADCSRKRYHCQKQADFDLCTECFNSGNFGSGMSSSDFILMEPGEASGASGGKWADQETLLLLEALELFKENWNEIAEHVATKTKAQCILHFLQMPIEDSFLDNDDMKDVQEMAKPASTKNDLSVPKDSSEPSGEKPCKDQPDQTERGSGLDYSDQVATESGKDDPEPSEKKTDCSAAQPATPVETLNRLETPDGKVTQEKDDDVIIKALKEAFDAAGCPVTAEDNLCFAEAGNPVMAIAAFLSELVEPGLATASARSSLKSISSSSPGSQLAERHCFILEDPPDDNKEQIVSVSTATEKADQDAMELVNQVSENGKEITIKENSTNRDEEKPTNVSDKSHQADGQIDKKDSNPGDNPGLHSEGQDVCSEKSEFSERPDEEKSPVVQKSDEEKCQVAKKLDEEKSHESDKPDEEKSQDADKPDEEKSEISEQPDEKNIQVAEKLDEATGTVQAQSKGGNEPQDCALQDDQCHTDRKDQDDSSCKVMPPPNSVTERNMNSVPEVVQGTDAPKDVDMESISVVSDKMEQQETLSAVPAAGVGSETGEDKMEADKSEDPKMRKTTLFIDDDDNVAKVKRAALATLSAAAVKAKLLADQEEDEIKQLATALIEKQLRKLEIKLSFFTEMESAVMRVREQLERSRQKLFSERTQIIASRLGLTAASSRASSHPLNRMPASLLNSMLRPPMNMVTQRPLMSRPVMASAAPTVNMSGPPDIAGESPVQPAIAEKSSPVGTN